MQKERKALVIKLVIKSCVASCDFSWMLYEKPDFQGRTIALEEGVIELNNVWAEDGAETEPQSGSPMQIGSIRLAVWVSANLPSLLNLKKKNPARCSAGGGGGDGRSNCCVCCPPPYTHTHCFCRITASPASICLLSRRAGEGSRLTMTTRSRRARSESR